MAVMVALLVLAALAGLVIALFILYVKQQQKFWQQQGIFTVTSKMPIIGHFGEMMLKKKSFADVILETYNEIQQKGKKFGGVYQFTRPMLFITDPDIIREVTVTQFDHFVNRRPFAQSGVDKLISRSMLNLQNDEWREMRHSLSPTFTGSKLKGMLELMNKTCQQFTKFLISRPDPNEPLNMRESFRRFAADVICTTAYGTVEDSINTEDAPFYKKGIKLMDTKGLRGLVFMGYLLSPKLMDFLKIPFVPEELSTFFIDSIRSTINYRETQNKSRPDMIQLLVDARKNQNIKLGKELKEKSDLDIVAQAFTFFLGGFDTISTALCFAAQLLAMHPDVQERVREELDAAISKNEGQLNNETLKNLVYMDMVMAEVLRLYPPAPMVDRNCCKAFELKEHGLKLEDGMAIAIPIMGLHYDKNYFPDPEKFDPERFSEANKKNIKSFTYLPFGAGPRNCIGIRFAQLEMKLCIAHLLATTELSVCKRTAVPIKLSTDSTQLLPVGGFWLNVRARANPSI